MVELQNLIDVTVDNDDFVFLKVRPEMEFELQLLGFTGNETGFRFEKGTHLFQKFFKAEGEPRCVNIMLDGTDRINATFKLQIKQVIECLIRLECITLTSDVRKVLYD